MRNQNLAQEIRGEHPLKDTFIFAPDLMSAAVKSEISVDGKTWTPLSEGKYTKAQLALKK